MQWPVWVWCLIVGWAIGALMGGLVRAWIEDIRMRGRIRRASRVWDRERWWK